MDEYQRAFCTSNAPRIRLLAPAGSGKTTSLLWRCKQIHERRGGAARFLIVAFTRAARDELRKRLAAAEFDPVRSSIEVATLNGWGYRRVRQLHHNPKLLANEKDRTFAFQNSLQPVWRKHALISRLVDERNAFQVGKTLMNLIELLKSLGFIHQGLTEDSAVEHLVALRALRLHRILERAFRELEVDEFLEKSDTENVLREFLPFWIDACKTLIEQAQFTFEDQKYVAFLDIRAQIDAGRRPVGGSRLTHVLVDEFQDINLLDLGLLKSIVDYNNSELTIVGDDDQAIFEWRGASFRFILEPERHVGGAFETFILRRNYRCPANLVEHSIRLINLNGNRYRKDIVPMNRGRATIELVERRSFVDVIDAVMDIVREHNQSAGNRRLALIGRKRAQLIPYQIMLAAADTPFCAAEDLQIFLSDAFKRLIDALTIRIEADQPASTRVAIAGVVRLCDLVKRFPLNKKERNALEGYLHRQRPRNFVEALAALVEYRGPLKGSNPEGVMSNNFASAIMALLRSKTVSDAIDALGNEMAGFQKDYGKSHEDIFYSDPPFFYLSRFAERYGSDFERLINDLEIAKSQLAQLPADDDEGSDTDDRWGASIHLMTALRAKGKEFDTVVLLDVMDGIWPSVNAETVEEKEQERRLFYVAMTRAKKRLVITSSQQIGGKIAIPSPFLREAGLVG